MGIPFYHIDAFSECPFSGNPAVICPLEKWLPDETLQAIAQEHNLSETAYYVPRQDGVYDLRWFTPAVEVDLCGHATLASAYVLLDLRKEVSGPQVAFHSKSGVLNVERSGSLYALDFPARPPQTVTFEDTQLVGAALGSRPQQVLAARDYLCIFESADEVAALRPNMAAIAGLDRFAVIVTAPGRDCDFVSRFFAPGKGVPEDPVTGSAHCALIPFWAGKLGKQALFARQISQRGGELFCEMRSNRVKIAGHAYLYAEGLIELPTRVLNAVM